MFVLSLQLASNGNGLHSRVRTDILNRLLRKLQHTSTWESNTKKFNSGTQTRYKVYLSGEKLADIITRPCKSISIVSQIH